MTPAEALELCRRRQLHVNGGPAPVAKSEKDQSARMSYAVAPYPTGAPRGIGSTLVEAVENMLAQEDDRDVGDLLS